MYVSGWIKTGPTGVIANTMYGAHETAETIVKDFKDGKIEPKSLERYREFTSILKQNPKVVQYKDWEKADIKEISMGVAKQKIREKIVSVDQLVRVAKSD